MTIFLSGGSKNGKSTLGERAARALAGEGPLWYVATMIPHDEEDRARIRRHRQDREGCGFQTVEQGWDLSSCLAGRCGTFLVDSVIESLNLRKVVTVVSADPEAVKQFILEALNRSATVYTAKGAYTGKEEQVRTTVLTRRQTVALRNHLRRVDPKAFLTIVNSSEIVGKGFRTL